MSHLLYFSSNSVTINRQYSKFNIAGAFGGGVAMYISTDVYASNLQVLKCSLAFFFHEYLDSDQTSPNSKQYYSLYSTDEAGTFYTCISTAHALIKWAANGRQVSHFIDIVMIDSRTGIFVRNTS